MQKIRDIVEEIGDILQNAPEAVQLEKTFAVLKTASVDWMGEAEFSAAAYKRKILNVGQLDHIFHLCVIGWMPGQSRFCFVIRYLIPC